MTRDSRNDAVLAKLFAAKARKGDLRKRELVLTAIRGIATEGIENMTLDSVGKQLGIRRSHVAYYFKTRDELVEAAIRLITMTAQELTVRRLETATTPRQQLIAVVDGAFDWARKHPEHLAVMSYFYYSCAFRKPHRTLHTRIRRSGRERLVALLAASPAARGVGTAALERHAREIQGLITGLLTDWNTTQEGRSLKEVREETLTAVLARVEGLLPAEPD